MEDIDLLSYIREQLDKGFAIGEPANMGRENLIAQIQEKKRLKASNENPLNRINDILLASLKPFDKAKFISALN